MWSSRLFWKLFFTYAVLNLISAGTFVAVVSRSSERLMFQEVELRLEKAALLVRSNLQDHLGEGRSVDLQQKVCALGQETQIRITLVDMVGMVLADSGRATLEDVARMDNHRRRPELLQAAEDGSGSSERRSATLGKPLKYFALRAGPAENPVGLVRVSSPLDEINAQVWVVQRLIWTVAVLVSISGLVITYWVVARIIQPVSVLTRAARSVTADDYTQHVDIRRRDELGILGSAFNKMNERMARRVTKLRETGERMSTVLEGMVEGVLAVDEARRILFANSAAGNLLGFNRDEVQNAPLSEAVSDKAIHGIVLDQFECPEPQLLEIEVGQTAGQVLGISSTQLPGEPCPGVVLVLHDVTELRRLESLRQEFVANVSHELKTPLSSIKAYAETLREGAVHDPTHNLQFVQRIEEQADRLHQLIQDLLSLARIESGQQTLDIVTVSVAKVANACLAEWATSAGAKSIGLQAVGPSLDLKVKADEDGLRQILDNLVDNAIKYTPNGGSVEVKWQSEDDHVRIDVTDTGIGIALADQSRIFERFFRVDKARSRELGGTGLGLSIVKHLVQSLSGTVTVASSAGKGSRFTVYLPQE